MKNTHYLYCRMAHNFDIDSVNAPTVENFAEPDTPRHYTPDTTMICTGLTMDLQFKDFLTQQASAVATLDLKGVGMGTQAIQLNAVKDSIKISKITINGTDITDFKHENDFLSIPYNLNHDIVIQIKISFLIDHPRSGLHWILPDPKRSQQPTQVWTQGESEEARYWIPCIDNPSFVYSTRFIVTVPTGFDVISNGRLIQKKDNPTDKSITFEWFQDQPHPAYLISLCIGKFVSYTDKPIRENTPLIYYADSEQYTADDLQRTFKETPQMIKFLATKLGVEFPWAKYSQTVLDQFRGAMENTSATSWFWNSLITVDDLAAYPNPHSTEEVNIHELSHQWFGDLVVLHHWSNAFQKEGMVTYLSSCYLEEFYGKDYHYIDMYQNQKDYFQESTERYSRPIVYNKYVYSFDVYDDHTYPGGAWRWHMVRRILGDSFWWKTLQFYLTENRHKAVEVIDFIKAAEKVTGKNLREFFDDWIFRAGYPKIKFTYEYNKDSKVAILKAEQKQAIKKTKDDKEEKDIQQIDYDNLFSLTFDISWLDKQNNWHTIQTTIPKASVSSLSFSADSEPKTIYINSNLGVLMDVELDLGTDMNKALAEYGPDALCRTLAIKALINKDLEKEFSFIVSIIDKEFTKCLKAYRLMLTELSETNSPQVKKLLVDWLMKYTNEPSRLALLILALGNKFEGQDVADTLLPLLQHKNTRIIALAVRYLGNSQSPSVTKVLYDYLDKSSFNDAYAIAASFSLGVLREPTEEIVLKLIATAENSKYHFQTRQNALSGIARHANLINPGLKEKVIPKIEALLYDPSIYIRMESIRTLSSLKSHSSRPVIESIIGQFSVGVQANVRRILDKYAKEDPLEKEVNQLRKEVKDIAKQNKELLEKLTKIELLTSKHSVDTTTESK